MYENDQRIVLSLDAGGTNFVFSAIQAYHQVVEPICLPAVTDNLEGCLQLLEQGFRQVIRELEHPPVAISFAFPGPADYAHGIIGDLPNLKAFRGGVALGPWLEECFGLPVFINNDGNLFAYGEALAGMLPQVNAQLREAGSQRAYRNLLGITLGTGFGAGVVIDGTLLTGDNGCGGDVWCMRNIEEPSLIAEESVSIRAVKQVYQELAGRDAASLSGKDIYEIAEGRREGDAEAARQSFARMGHMAGETIAAALDIVDGLVVIGGGIMGASHYILPSLVDALNGKVHTRAGDTFPLMQSHAYNWEDESQRSAFMDSGAQQISVPLPMRDGARLTMTERSVPYLRHKAVCVCKSRNGASTSIMYGAYAYALANLPAMPCKLSED